MSFKAPFTYISAADTATLVKQSKVGEIQVVDVRDDDFVGGNIVGAVNHPSESIQDTVEEMVSKYSDGETQTGYNCAVVLDSNKLNYDLISLVPKIIFHCALSQVRGPKSARIYSEALQRLKPDSNQQVLVLRDGFTGFQQYFRDDPKLVEKFQKMYHD